MGPTREQLIPIVEEAVKAAGYDLVDLEFRREGHGFVLRAFIDLPEILSGGEDGGVSHTDCERASRSISAALDVADPIPQAFALEVSSPGLARPVRRETDYRRFAGRRARIKLREPVEGRRNFVCTLRGAADGVVTIEADGREFRFPLSAVAKATLEYDV
ncbi:MAG TPA: ribosome maturation factor RimP [Polyangia bacterium]|jgi:ribosome maturation factor RimP